MAPAELARIPEGFVSPAGESVHWKELAPIDVVGEHRQEHATFGFAVHIARVAVDPGTGDVRVERLIVGYDCGKVIDPVSVRGQLAGAAVMGVGGALLEESSYDPQGQPLSTTFVDYLMPTASQAPDVEAHTIERDLPSSNPLGIKGAGEAGIIGVGAAVANAVADALGRRGRDITRLPLRPAAMKALFAPGDEAQGGLRNA
jgi:CO/xanthine dehydrogenase Mo-binding subunit